MYTPLLHPELPLKKVYDPSQNTMSLSTSEPFVDQEYVDARAPPPSVVLRNTMMLLPSLPVDVSFTRPPYVNRKVVWPCVFQTSMACWMAASAAATVTSALIGFRYITTGVADHLPNVV